VILLLLWKITIQTKTTFTYTRATSDDNNKFYISPGLVLRHAPIHWMLLRKLVRLSVSEQRRVDVDDAVIFLNVMLRQKGDASALTKDEISNFYGMNTGDLKDDVLRQISLKVITTTELIEIHVASHSHGESNIGMTELGQRF
jgi:hypothetical protein